MIMDNDESNSYFLSCKSHRLIFVKYLFISVKDNDRYSGIFKYLFIYVKDNDRYSGIFKYLFIYIKRQ